MLGLDLAETVEVPYIRDTKWTVGLLPLGKYEEIVTAIGRARQPFLTHARTHLPAGSQKDTVPQPEEEKRKEQELLAAMAECETCSELLEAAAVAALPANRELVRWGLRSTSTPIPLKTETVRYAGKEYTILTEAAVERLCRIRDFGADLVSFLATQILRANQIDEKTALGFK